MEISDSLKELATNYVTTEKAYLDRMAEINKLIQEEYDATTAINTKLGAIDQEIYEEISKIENVDERNKLKEELELFIGKTAHVLGMKTQEENDVGGEREESNST